MPIQRYFQRHLQRHPNWSSSLLALTVGILSACSPSAPTSQTAPASAPASDLASPAATAATGTNLQVVATSSVLCDLVQTVAAETIDLTCLVKAGVDPHAYEPTPADRKAIEDAQLVLYSGYDFEPSLIQLIQAASGSAPKVAVGEAAVPKPLMGVHEHEHRDEHGDAHAEEQQAEGAQAEAAEPDPHIWHNAQNGIQMVKVIQEQLTQVAPANADLYAQNAQALTAELTQIDAWIQSQIATIPTASRKLVTTHDALSYYSAAYDIPVEGALQGISTEEKPTAARVKELADEIKADQVPTIFAEITESTKLLETVAQAANVQISDQELFADGLGEAGSDGDTYPKMLIANTKAVVEGLGGQYSPFQPK
ncbi:MAG: zinc ABC transporter substrate-binding protein [Pegethrix bostrychoides GSE-TBD4-15B]|jgi:manganese/iron transport system substrate-binding protein|uniref:Zinc ABC transporter substrate-binding protein n=1 Tax=Pegethrix bostrychoides GSE-TBD4-15B TaxID=2839662 RepID=A0A951P864_9CYAN|nr:zinc ABC transporter substrate-binding protein [Pegethrix bostrychoides GSE-TBD4-15B]